MENKEEEEWEKLNKEIKRLDAISNTIGVNFFSKTILMKKEDVKKVKKK